MSGIHRALVTEDENQRFLSKMNSVGPKLHQISPKKFCTVYNTYAIVLQCYINRFEVLCSCSGRRNALAIFVTECHKDFQTPRMAIALPIFSRQTRRFSEGTNDTDDM